MKRFLYLIVVVIASFPDAVAQTKTPEVLYYSRITKSFDRQPPIGVAFQIKGSVTPDIVAVKLESFGFDMQGRYRAHDLELVNVLTNNDHSRPYCEVLAEVRNDDIRPRGHSSWERPADANGAKLSQFTLNHPRLYYGRRYVFLITYYKRVPDSEKKKITEKFVTSMLTVIQDKLEGGESLTEAEWNAELNELLPEMRGAQESCGPEILRRRTLQPLDISDFFLTFAAETYQLKLNTIKMQEGRETVDRLLPELQEKKQGFATLFENLKLSINDGKWEDVNTNIDALAAQLNVERIPPASRLKALNENVIEKKDELSGLDETNRTNRQNEIDAAAEEIAKIFEGVKDNIDAEKWDEALTALHRFIVFEGEVLTLGQNLLAAIATIEAASGQAAAMTMEDLVQKTLAALPFPEDEELMMAVSSQPYFESMEEEQQFLISLDGGLNYVSKFSQLVPTVGVNFKLNRVDYNDPWNDRIEWSIVLGLGMAKPDDLDPDYKGIFDTTGDHSLMVGFGLRPPKAGKLIRIKAGAAFYRQADRNPIVKDFTTKVSPYVGLSLNWDTLDFIADLFTSRSNFSIGQ